MDKDDARAYFLQAYPKPATCLAKAKVVITSYVKAKRYRDDDNWRARFAGFMDGLTGLAWKDDSIDCIGKPDHRIIVDPEKAGPFGLVEFEITQI